MWNSTGFAAAAAGTGDPLPLLTLEANRPEPRRPLRPHIELNGAVLLMLAVAAALVWANSPWGGSYEAFWSNTIVATNLRGAINEGLMTLFFLIVGLEAKRELDLGELRDRRRLTVPVIASVTGVAVSVALYLLITAGHTGAAGWGVAVSTDTALALGALGVAARTNDPRLRVFLLALLVVDDLVALAVITLAYPQEIDVAALIAAAGLMGLLLVLRSYAWRRRSDNGGNVLYWVSILAGVGLWVALFESGVDPVISGLAIGLLTRANVPPRVQRTGAISPNDRLQHRLHPWTTRVVVPLFALANAGVHLDGTVLSGAVTSTVTWGIVVAFVVGKPLGILAAAWITAKGAPRAGKLPVSWRELTGTAASAGIGFTVSLLIASRAFDGAALDQAKVGVLVTALISPLLAAISFRAQRADRPMAVAACAA